MLKHIEEYEKYVEISGFRGVKIADAKVLLESVRKKLPEDCEIQLFNAELVATWQHLYFALINALKAFATKQNLSNSVAVETALYASTQRQISKALTQIGVSPKTRNVAVVVISGNAGVVEAGLEVISKKLGASPDESVLALTTEKIKRIKQVLGISKRELEAVSAKGTLDQALVDLIIERVALLATRL